MSRPRPASARSEPFDCFSPSDAMRDELSHALHEALFELQALPETEDGALVGLYAVMDDLEDAVERTEELDGPVLHGS